MTESNWPEQPNYDESRIPDYQLPDPLKFEDGTALQSPADWVRRRAEILGLFEEHMYGRMPAKPEVMRVVVHEHEPQALGGLAERKQVSLYFTQGDLPRLDVLIYLPLARSGPAPVFVGLNFTGNVSVNPDPGIRLSEQWVISDKGGDPTGWRAGESSRGQAQSRWPVEEITARGYAVVTACYGDLDPDYDDGFANGVHPLFDGSEARTGSSWGAFGAWAWGLSRMMDYVEMDPDLDETRAAVVGHSRLGKAALWAGVQDTRFGLVIGNNSGCGGAALFRRRIGETAALINVRFPHWFCQNFHRYNLKEDQLPVDQHQLLALMAPRAVYVASADEDLWADPRGEYLGAQEAARVYQFLGLGGLYEPDRGGDFGPVGYHIRAGKHDITIFDWERYMNYADQLWSRQ